MARKGDAHKATRQMDYQGGLAQNYLNNTRDDLKPQNQALQNRYNRAADQSEENYGQMMQSYNDLIGQTQNAYGQAKQGYSDFAKTGGYSDQDIQDLRARAIAPTRAVYANAQNNIDRQRTLQGYSPNYTAATAKLTRDLGQSVSDANVNANASIADSVRQGKLAGLGGLNQTDNSQLAALANALSGQRGLYGQTPGQTSMYGSQLNESNSQMLQTQQLQQQIAQMLIQAQLQSAGIPSNYQQGLGNVGGTMGVIGKMMTLGTMGGNPGSN